MKKSIGYKFNRVLCFMFVSLMFLASCSEDENEIPNESATFTLEFNGKKYTESEIENESKKISDEDISRMLENHFGITEINKIDQNTSKVKLEGDYNITEYVFGKSDKRIYIAQNSVNTDEYRILQGNLINSTLDIYLDELINYSDMKQNILSKHRIYNSNDQRFGSPTEEISSGDNEGFCQREGGETQSQCEDREYDEFVEDCFVCWLAYHTNPGVPILISATCLC